MVENMCARLATATASEWRLTDTFIFLFTLFCISTFSTASIYDSDKQKQQDFAAQTRNSSPNVNPDLQSVTMYRQ